MNNGQKIIYQDSFISITDPGDGLINFIVKSKRPRTQRSVIDNSPEHIYSVCAILGIDSNRLNEKTVNEVKATLYAKYVDLIKSEIRKLLRKNNEEEFLLKLKNYVNIAEDEWDKIIGEMKDAIKPN